MIFVRSAMAALYALLTILVAIGLAWVVLAQFNYNYGVWHDYGGIDQAIETYAPQNRYRDGFADTSRDQRLNIFAQIVRAVHNRGEGLSDISYSVPDHSAPIPLLHSAEVVHLQDVARVISFLTWCLLAVGIVWSVTTGFALVNVKKLPSVKSQLLGFLCLSVVSVLTLLVVGWVNVFNQLHIWVFPGDHQWFFYYQDSLMSTMMWAPHLFKYIGITWAVLATVFFGGLLFITARLQKLRSA